MTAASAGLPTSSNELSWVDRYEGLRKQGLELGARWLDDAQGLVLFLRQGMVSWVIELATAAQKPIPARPSQPDRGVLVRDDRAAVTRMLASMVGSAVAEARA